MHQKVKTRSMPLDATYESGNVMWSVCNRLQNRLQSSDGHLVFVDIKKDEHPITTSPILLSSTKGQQFY